MILWKSLLIKKKKKCTTWELQVKFYLGQYEDSSLGDSTSDSSEKLFQEVMGEDSIYVILVKGEHVQSSTYFFQRVSASHKEQTSP